MTERKLDRVYEEDWRSLDHTVGRAIVGSEGAVPEYRPRSYTWSVDAWFDQGTEGACVGFAFAHDLIARPDVVEEASQEDAFEIYREAQKIDPWEGEDYEGTSVLAGAKILQQRGHYDGYNWALSLEEVVLGIGYFGPAVLGCNWYDGMDRLDRDGFIRVIGNIRGGHAVLLHAVKVKFKRGTWMGWWRRSWRDVDIDRSYVTVWNSWGPHWGDGGRAKLSLRDLDRLLREQGDLCFPVRAYKGDQ